MEYTRAETGPGAVYSPSPTVFADISLSSPRIGSRRRFRRVFRASASILCAVLGAPTAASEVPPAPEEDALEVLVVTGHLDSLPGANVPSLTGFEKPLTATPRSASTVSDELMTRFNIRDIDGLIALVPGSFTQSFFGVAGSLDIRGTSGEVYFRGIRRLDNAGNYPTPIGASERVDVVRGPASPIHGPAKIGGYLNFNPKSARIEATGEFIDEPTGTAALDVGSWGRTVASVEAGGHGQLGGEDFGYWLYVEGEDSGSFYEHTNTTQGLLQASFDMDLTPTLQLQFGGMHHDYAGNQVGGWNRLTQALVDTGAYLAGQPLPLDVDGDGRISHREYDVDGDGFSDLNPFAAGLEPGTAAALDTSGAPVCTIGATLVFGCHPHLLALVDPGLVMLHPSQVNVAPNDGIDNRVTTLYFDAILAANAWTWRNQSFFESYDHRNEVAIGFSQFHDSWVFENKLVASRAFAVGAAAVDVQLSPSVRLTAFRHGNDYTNEHFDRRDLTQPPGPLDTRLLATQIDDDYTEYYVGDYLDIGLAALADVDWGDFNALLGARFDSIDAESRQPVEKLLLPSAAHFCPDAACVVAKAADRLRGVSWTASLSYRIGGFFPYATFSRQATIVAGQGADIGTSSLASDGAFDTSTLREYGVKASLLNDALYFALAVYEQQRTDQAVQQVTTNQASRTTGTEFELRWAAHERLLLTLAYTNIEVVNLNTLEAGGRFSFVGADDIPNIPPETFYGGTLGGRILRPGVAGATRAGVPESILSLTGTFHFGNGVAASVSASDVDATTSGFAKSVRLPAYTLVDASLVVERGQWHLTATAKNLTNERYFRANFPNLFGGVIVLPELPRHYGLRIEYRW